jgi:hypothetical protein
VTRLSEIAASSLALLPAACSYQTEKVIGLNAAVVQSHELQRRSKQFGAPFL